jgi:hypothetical protein
MWKAFLLWLWLIVFVFGNLYIVGFGLSILLFASPDNIPWDIVARAPIGWMTYNYSNTIMIIEGGVALIVLLVIMYFRKTTVEE